MSRNMNVLEALSLLLLLFCCTGGVADVPSKPFKLKILHYNDVHARVEPATANQSPCKDRANQTAETECYGGLPKLAALAKNFREEAKSDPETMYLVLDAGDQFMGTIWNTFYKGEAIGRLLQLVVPDAFTFGNHEFDFNSTVLKAFTDSIDIAHNVISCNIDFSGDAVFGTNFPGYVLKTITAGGVDVTVGIIGYTTPETSFLSKPSKDIKFADEIEAINKCIAQADAETTVDYYILLGHSGYIRDQELAAAADSRVIAIVGGHSHTLLGEEADVATGDDTLIQGKYPTWVTNKASGQDIPVVQAYWASKYAGVIAELVVDPATNKVSMKGNPVILSDYSKSPHYLADDPAAADLVASMTAELNKFRTTPVADVDVYLDGERDHVRMKETNLADLIADAIVAKCQSIPSMSALTMAISNGGGVRASINEGSATVEDVMTVLPFGNEITALQLKGSVIKTAIEQGLSPWTDGPDKKGCFPQVAGIKYTFDPQKPAMSRILSITDSDDKEILDDQTYLLATNEFMANGGDGYTALKANSTVVNAQVGIIADAVMEYMQNMKVVDIREDGRIHNIRDTTSSSSQAPTKATTTSSASVINAVSCMTLAFVSAGVAALA